MIRINSIKESVALIGLNDVTNDKAIDAYLCNNWEYLHTLPVSTVS